MAGSVEAIADKSVSRAEIKDLLTEFFRYMKEHFRDEERYMEEIKYPELEVHRRIHKEIIQSMIHLINTIKTTNDLKEKLYLISKKWLLEHILFEDMKITEFLRTLPISDELILDEITYLDDECSKQGKYCYICGCEGKIHNISLDIHRKIQVSKKDVRCKECDTTIQFLYKEGDNG